MKTLGKYWPWFVVLGFMASYETYAVISSHARTLSELYWQAQDGNAWLPYVVVGSIAVLLVHLVGKKWRRWWWQ